jgi:hypothetical protein
MKDLSSAVYLFIILLIFFGPAFSQDTQGIPILALKEREFDFGKVKEGKRSASPATLEIREFSGGSQFKNQLRRETHSQYPDQGWY